MTVIQYHSYPYEGLEDVQQLPSSEVMLCGSSWPVPHKLSPQWSVHRQRLSYSPHQSSTLEPKSADKKEQSVERKSTIFHKISSAYIHRPASHSTHRSSFEAGSFHIYGYLHSKYPQTTVSRMVNMIALDKQAAVSTNLYAQSE